MTYYVNDVLFNVLKHLISILSLIYNHNCYQDAFFKDMFDPSLVEGFTKTLPRSIEVLRQFVGSYKTFSLHSLLT